jgi:hypothetical protein
MNAILVENGMKVSTFPSRNTYSAHTEFASNFASG